MRAAAYKRTKMSRYLADFTMVSRAALNWIVARGFSTSDAYIATRSFTIS